MATNPEPPEPLDDLFCVLGEDGDRSTFFSAAMAERVRAEWDTTFPEDAPHLIARFTFIEWVDHG